MHEDRRPRVGHRGGRLDGAVGDHHRRLGVAAPHHPAVAAEHLDRAPLGDRGPGQHLRGELDALPADSRENELTFHVAPSRSVAAAPVRVVF